ncbi:hypothetical protein LG634_04415 [Streptomyces bambusae]|uniref:glycoside hydrolase family 71 protein n=1 Tax=Streptomyces bambusae TaxID=1550616 RepID=UPI001CFE99A3|nr:glycoside hydrolase family 71 protein [Streptomyces bambusae]MCB5164080.1 hypothetical protein [Streptomyces bambusae]
MSADPVKRRGRRRPSSHRRKGAGGKRSLLAFLIAGFLLVGAFAATGIAWDPFPAGGSGERKDRAEPEIGQPWSTGPGDGRGGGPGEVTSYPKPGASGGPSRPGRTVPPTEPPGGTPDGTRRPSEALPFNLPPAAELRKSGKLVFAHYFTPYPLSLDNARSERDYYTRNYLNPAGESGKHQRYGGLLRDRPLPVAPKAGNWELANLKEEVRTARDAGLDGFTLDMLSLSGKNWERSVMLLEAARSVDSRFKIMLMPDMTSLNTDPAGLAHAVAKLAASPAAHRLGDGRLVVSPFKAEAKSVDWWRQFMAELKQRHGIRTAFVPLFLDFGAHSGEFAPISYGFSEWGSRSYVGQESASRDVRRAHGMGKKWMQPVSVQDARPNQGIYDEAGNTATLRATWNHAIDDGADWVQLTTWNDYSEGSHFAPSLHNGHTYLDLTSYYLTRFKTGTWPKILRDTLYLTSRVQFASADPTGRQSLVMSVRGGSAAARDRVEILSFLKSPATVGTKVGGTAGSHRAPGGVHAELIPLRSGLSSATASRNGRKVAEVRSRYAVSRVVAVQDLQYYGVSGGRG